MSSVKGTITFVNVGMYDAYVYALDENGKESFVINLPPNQSSKQDTVDGQVWIVKDYSGAQMLPVTGGKVYIRITDSAGREVDTVTGKAGDQTYQIEISHIRFGGPEPAGSGGG